MSFGTVEERAGFDMRAVFDDTIKSGGVKSVSMRYLTDDEDCERNRKMKLLSKVAGKGTSEIVAPNAEQLALDIYNRVKQENSAELDKFEADKVIGRLLHAEVTECEASGDGYRVKLWAHGFDTVHIVATPTEEQRRRCESAARKVFHGQNFQDIKIALEPYGDIYDRLVTDKEGYSGEVPMGHKRDVIRRVFSAIDEEERPGDF